MTIENLEILGSDLSWNGTPQKCTSTTLQLKIEPGTFDRALEWIIYRRLRLGSEMRTSNFNQPELLSSVSALLTPDMVELYWSQLPTLTPVTLNCLGCRVSQYD